MAANAYLMGYTFAMLSVFPELLFLSPLAPTLLRLGAGAVFLLLAWDHFERREELGRDRFIVVGSGAWIPIAAAIVELCIALALLLGAYLQVAAIFAAGAALKQFVWSAHYPRFFTLSRTSSALLFVIALSLIFTGAGAFAFDLPL